MHKTAHHEVGSDVSSAEVALILCQVVSQPARQADHKCTEGGGSEVARRHQECGDVCGVVARGHPPSLPATTATSFISTLASLPTFCLTQVLSLFYCHVSVCYLQTPTRPQTWQFECFLCFDCLGRPVSSILIEPDFWELDTVRLSGVFCCVWAEDKNMLIMIITVYVCMNVHLMKCELNKYCLGQCKMEIGELTNSKSLICVYLLHKQKGWLVVCDLRDNWRLG